MGSNLYLFFEKRFDGMSIFSMGGNDLGHDQSNYPWNRFSFYNIKNDMDGYSQLSVMYMQ